MNERVDLQVGSNPFPSLRLPPPSLLPSGQTMCGGGHPTLYTFGALLAISAKTAKKARLPTSGFLHKSVIGCFVTQKNCDHFLI